MSKPSRAEKEAARKRYEQAKRLVDAKKEKMLAELAKYNKGLKGQGGSR